MIPSIIKKNLKKWTNCIERGLKKWKPIKKSATSVDGKEYRFVPVYRWQAENIDLDELEENGEEWQKAVEIVNFNIFDY